MRVKEMIRTMMSMTTTVQALKTMGIAEIAQRTTTTTQHVDGDPSKYLEPRDHEQSVGVPSILRDEFFTMRPQYAPDVNFKIEWGRKEMIQIVMRWTAKHPRKSTRQIPRLFWGNIGLVTKILQCSHFLGVK